MERAGESQDYTVFELPLERANDPDVDMMSTGRPVLKKDRSAYQERFVASHEVETEEHLIGRITGLSAVGIGLGIFAYVKYKSRNQIGD